MFRFPHAVSRIGAAAAAAAVLGTVPAYAQTDGDVRLRVHGDGLRLSASPRTPDQIAAFYSARGFPPAAVSALAEACLITFGLRSERADVVWLEPSRWRFLDADGRPVRRITREDWTARWEALDVPAASRATFGWTQLPEQRDLQPGEPVGGNLALEPVAGALSVEARFHTGADRAGPVIVLRLDGLSCPRGAGERP